MCTEPFEYFSWPDGTIDPWRSLKWKGISSLAVFARQVRAELRHIATFSADLVVSDSRLSSVVAAKILGKPCITILNQMSIIAPGFRHHSGWSDFSRVFSIGILTSLWSLSDEIIVPDFPPPNTIAAYNTIIPRPYRDKVKYYGPIISVRPKNLPSVAAIREKLGLDTRKTVFAALSGPTLERTWLAEKLVKAARGLSNDFQVVISLGNRNGHKEPWQEGNVRVYDWLYTRHEMLKASDLIVGRGGHTTVLEALAYGKPMILIPAQEQTEQIANTRRANEMGVAKALDQRHLSSQLLQERIEQVLNSKDFAERAQKFERLSSEYDAVENISQSVIQYLERENSVF